MNCIVEVSGDYPRTLAPSDQIWSRREAPELYRIRLHVSACYPGMAERFPSGPSARPESLPFPREQPTSRIGPQAVQGAKRRSGPLTARTDLESLRREGKEKPAAGSTREVVPDHHPAVESISWDQDEIEDIHLGLPKSD